MSPEREIDLEIEKIKNRILTKNKINIINDISNYKENKNSPIKAKNSIKEQNNNKKTINNDKISKLKQLYYDKNFIDLISDDGSDKSESKENKIIDNLSSLKKNPSINKLQTKENYLYSSPKKKLDFDTELSYSRNSSPFSQVSKGNKNN